MVRVGVSQEDSLHIIEAASDPGEEYPQASARDPSVDQEPPTTGL